MPRNAITLSLCSKGSFLKICIYTILLISCRDKEKLQDIAVTATAQNALIAHIFFDKIGDETWGRESYLRQRRVSLDVSFATCNISRKSNKVECAAIVWYPLFMKSYIFHDVYSIADVKHPQNSPFVSAGMDSYCFTIWRRQPGVMKRRNELTESKTLHVQGRRIRKRRAAMT